MTGVGPWRVLDCAPDEFASPDDLPDRSDPRWTETDEPVPAAQVVRMRDGAEAARDAAVDARDWWYLTDVVLPDGEHRPRRLEFDGIATVADLWLDGEPAGESTSMFVPFTLDLGVGPRTRAVALRVRALDPILRRRRPRGRWRSSLVPQQGLRWIRTSVLGRAPVFTGVPAVAGPWRGVRVRGGDGVDVTDLRMRTALDGTIGRLRIEATVTGAVGPIALEVGDHRADAAVADGRVDPVDGGETRIVLDVALPGVEPWWPHGYGEPRLYRPALVGRDEDGAAFRHELGAIGFRTVEADRADGGFGLVVNGVRVFCRGTCWTPVDPIALRAPGATRAAVREAADAGFTMLRSTGTMVYEDDEFWDACAEFGLLVWQEAMLATSDYPDDPGFEAELGAEAHALFDRIGHNPALAVFCGGSETEQQPTMLGLGAVDIPAVHRVLRDIAADRVPGVPYVTSSPSAPDDAASTVPPTHVGSGVSHYFGVGAYERGLVDARVARVRFASECLAFSNPPDDRAIEDRFGSLSVVGHHPVWKAAVPRDATSSWDFEDTRDHYVRVVLGEDARDVRRVDPGRYLDLGRAAVCVAMSETIGYWRRADSGCDGALVLAHRDLEPGAGWGLLDATGRPKAPWYAVARVSRPLAVILGEDGLDGLRLDIHHDGPADLVGSVRVRAFPLRGGEPESAEIPVRVPAHGSFSRSLDVVFGRTLDLDHVYRFGPRSFDCVAAEFVVDGEVVAENVRPTGGWARPVEQDPGLRASVAPVGPDSGEWELTVEASVTCPFVVVEVGGYRPEDSWFALAPGSPRRVLLRSGEGVVTPPRGRVRALNGVRSAVVEAPPTR